MEERVTTTKFIPITNRDNGGVTCVLSNGRTISFNKGETRKVAFDDLLELNSSDGGKKLLTEYLIIKDKEALAALEFNTEPEYYYTEKEIRKLLQEGTLDQLEDCLNFAPEGVIDILKDVALEIELPDTRKRKLIAKKTGYNIDNILRVKQVLDAKPEGETDDKNAEKVRKSTPVVSDESNKRKSIPISVEDDKKKYPDYKIVSATK